MPFSNEWEDVAMLVVYFSKQVSSFGIIFTGAVPKKKIMKYDISPYFLTRTYIFLHVGW